VDATLSLEESHRLVSEFERRVCEALPDVVEIVTHIEPAHPALADERLDDAKAEQIKAQVVEVGDRVCGVRATHHVRLRRLPNGYDVSLHVVAPGDTPIVESHLLAEEVERRLRAAIDGLEQVTVHVEPPEERDK
jgi:divalent metal cation (Fe/Co/Zn/Cd) transporter